MSVARLFIFTAIFGMVLQPVLTLSPRSCECCVGEMANETTNATPDTASTTEVAQSCCSVSQGSKAAPSEPGPQQPNPDDEPGQCNDCAKSCCTALVKVLGDAHAGYPSAADADNQSRRSESLHDLPAPHLSRLKRPPKDGFIA